MRFRWPAIWLDGRPTRNPIAQLGALVGVLSGIGAPALVAFFIFVAPLILLVRWIT